MEAQVTKFANQMFFQLHQVRQIAPYLSYPYLVTVIHEMVTSKMDYSNSLYMNLPLRLTWKLQLVQNAVA